MSEKTFNVEGDLPYYEQLHADVISKTRELFISAIVVGGGLVFVGLNQESATQVIEALGDPELITNGLDLLITNAALATATITSSIAAVRGAIALELSRLRLDAERAKERTVNLGMPAGGPPGRYPDN